MSERPKQNYANHRQFTPLYHYIVLPIISIAVPATIWHAVRHPSNWEIWQAIFVTGLSLGFWATRGMALRVQDRVIRLEMRLRLQSVLPPALAPRIPELRVRDLVSLRFASDAELPDLVGRCLAGEFKERNSLKKAIRDWQADWLRA